MSFAVLGKTADNNIVRAGGTGFQPVKNTAKMAVPHRKGV